MALRDFALLALICLAWASNSIVSKFAVTDLGMAPLFYACARSAFVALVLFPWLFPMPRPRWRLIFVSLLMGGGNSTLIFVALKTATPSEVAIVSQLGVPITTVLSLVMLGERLNWRRGIGIAMTLVGALTVMWDPAGVHASVGLYYVVAACFVGSLGAVMMKQLAGVRPLVFQAWVGLTSVILLTPFSLAFEPGQIDVAITAGWALAAAIAYSALAGSVGAHTGFYILMQRYEANLIMPLMLMTPLATIGLGVLITHDPFDLRMGIGTVVALTGVLIIALRPARVLPLLLAWRNRAQ